MSDPVTRSIVIDRGADELYRLWTDPDNIPRFMKHIRSVVRTGPGTTHWTMTGPAGRDVEWDARIIRAEPGRLVAWESIRGDIQAAGQVSFRPIDADHTEVIVTLRHQPKDQAAGAAGSPLADPAGNLEESLGNLKSLAQQTPSRRT